MSVQINKFVLITAILFLAIFLWLIFPLPIFFSNDDFGGLPLIAEKKFIFSNLPRPLANLSIYLDILTWGMKPFGFYLTNLLIHIGNSTLVYLLYLRIVKNETGRINVKIQAIAAAILFLFYSNNSEAIYWISARTSSLTCFFILTSLFFFLKRNTSRYYLILSMLSFIAGLFTYETSWIIPGAILALWVFEKKAEKEKTRIFLVIFACYLVVFIIYLVWRYKITGEFVSDYVVVNYAEGNFERIMKNLAQLVTRTLVPPMHSTKSFVLTAGLLLFLLTLVIIIKKGLLRSWLVNNKIICLFTLFCLSLIPASSIGISIHTTEGERFIYLANAFLSMLLIAVLFASIRKRSLQAAVFIILISIQFILLSHKASDYRESNIMTEKIISEIKNQGPKEFETIYTINQPDNLNGAVMLRIGIEYAIRWLAPDLKFKELVIISPEQLTSPYRVQFKKISFAEIQNDLMPYSIPFRMGKDCIILFSPKTCFFIE